MKTWFSPDFWKKEHKRISSTSEEFEIGAWKYFESRRGRLGNDKEFFYLFVHIFLDRGTKAEGVALAVKDMIKKGLLEVSELESNRVALEKILENHKVSWQWGKKIVTPESIVQYLLGTCREVLDRFDGRLYGLYQHIQGETDKLPYDRDTQTFIKLKWLLLELASLPQMGPKLASFLILMAAYYEVCPEFNENPEYLEVAMDIHLKAYFRRLFAERGKPVHKNAIDWYARNAASLMAAVNDTDAIDIDYIAWHYNRSRS